jgi:hypothetical protein
MAMKHRHNILLYCLLNIPILSAHATPRDIGEGLTGDSNSKALENINDHYGLWSGIGRLTNSSGERCTAALIDTRNTEGKAIGPAYLITSGHCVFAEYGTARINENLNANITFNYFHDVPEQHKTYKIRKASWSSMVGMDLAILEVDAPLATLIQDWIMPLKLSPHTPTGSHDVVNVGAPVGFSEKRASPGGLLTRTVRYHHRATWGVSGGLQEPVQGSFTRKLRQSDARTSLKSDCQHLQQVRPHHSMGTFK